MGYFNPHKEKDVYKDVDIFLKERGYSFGHKELAISLFWINSICLKRKDVAIIDLIRKELESLKEIRYKYEKYSEKNHLTDYSIFKSFLKNHKFIKTKEISHIDKISKRIEELKYNLLLEPLTKIKVSPRNLIILVWGYAFKKNRESIDWELMGNIYSWFSEDQKNTNLASLFDTYKISRKTLRRMYYKHTSEKQAGSIEKKNLTELILYVYKKAFVEKKISTGIIIPKKNNEIKNWK